MTVTIGSQLGSYEITELLGKGGMGEVYRAKDKKLKREVAIKILPDEFSTDDDRLTRFQREAEVLASLNHPNIGAIHDFQDSNSVRFLVLELVEGDTLADVIASRGAMPVEEVLPIALQICEALEAAHEKGIVHRDLKPANIKVSVDGKVKVLDFGLAKALAKSVPDVSISQSPTLSLQATSAGVIIGTAAYIPPEQVKGLESDERGDIFAFGCVLFELLTGKQTFEGDTIAEILASVLKSEPKLELLPQSLPSRLVDLVRRCLEKNPKRRWYAIGDVRVELEAIAATPVVQETQAALTKPIWLFAVSVVAGLLAGAAIMTAVLWKPKLAAPPVARFSFSLPEGQTFSNTGRQALALSPDGTKIVYQANRGLYIRSISEAEARLIPGTDITPINPVFSPDGKSIVFFSTGTLKKIAVTGGTPITLCTATNPFGMSWSSDGILFGQGGKGILRVSASGGEPEVVVATKEGELAYGPQLLPDGKTILFTLASGLTTAEWDKAQIVVQPLKGGTRKLLIQAGSDARYVPTGHIVYALQGTLLAVPFDINRLEVVAGPTPVLEGVRRAVSTNPTGAAQFSFSGDGALIYLSGPATGVVAQNNGLAFMDRDGKFDLLKIPAGTYAYPRISPNGKQVAFESDAVNRADIWIFDLSGASAPRKLTFGGENRYPIWSSDSQRVAFQSNREGDSGIWWQRADGTGAVERLTKADAGVTHIPDSWSPNGQWFSFTLNKSSQPGDEVWVFSMRDKTASPFAQIAKSNSGRSVFSPDGKWLAYQSSPPNSVFVQPFPSNGTQYLISKGIDPLWSPDGKELFLSPAPSTFVEVGISTAPTFSFGNPKPFPNPTGGIPGPGLPRGFDIMPDGKRLLTVTNADLAQNSNLNPQINIVLNWFEDLKQRVPVH